MKKGIKVIVSLLLSFTMIFTLNISAFAERLEEFTDEVEVTVSEEVPEEEIYRESKDSLDENEMDKTIDDEEELETEAEELDIGNETKDDSDTIPEKEEPAIEETNKEEIDEDKDNDSELDDEDIADIVDTENPELDPELDLEEEMEKPAESIVPVPEPEFISLISQVEPLNYSYTNGEILDYQINVTNDGSVEVYNINISDEFGLEHRIDILYPGENEIIYGEYLIPIYNELEQLENNISIYADYEDETLTMDLNFRTDVYIPKGSIRITNDVDYVDDENLEFHIFVRGPNNTEYVVSLKNRESAVIDNLFIGEYTISPVAPMDYTSNRNNINISILPNSLDHNRWVSYYQNNANGFYNRSDKQIQGYKVNSRDITYAALRYSNSREEKREAYVFLDLGISEVEQPDEVTEIIPEEEKDINNEEEKEKEEVVVENIDETNKNLEEIENEEILEQDQSIVPIYPSEETIIDEVKEPENNNVKEDIELPEEIPILKDKEELTADE